MEQPNAPRSGIVGPTPVSKKAFQESGESPKGKKKDKLQNFEGAALQAKEEVQVASDIPSDKLSAMGEIVYLKNQLDFKDKQKESKRDQFFEENLLDVKRLLKNSAFSNTQQGRAEGEVPDPTEKK